MRVLITGSTGYLGSKTVDMLAAAGGMDIFGIDLNHPKNAELYTAFHKGSVTDATPWRASLRAHGLTWPCILPLR